MEFELKLELDSDECEHVRRAVMTRLQGDAAAQDVDMRSTYFDTADQALRRAGASLRLRQVEGITLQTVKIATEVKGGVSNPVEHEVQVFKQRPQISAIPNKKARNTIEALINGSPLRKQFETNVTRTKLPLQNKQGAAELALDCGQVRTARRASDLCELELELKSGDAESLMEIASDVFADVPIRFSGMSKAERGYRLVDRMTDGSKMPARASWPDLEPRMDIGTAFRHVTASAVDQILSNWQVVLVNDDPEGPHQLRIGLRRLRTALRMFRPEIDAPALRELNDMLRKVAHIAGRLRDRDVLLSDIVDPIANQFDDDGAGAELHKRLVAICATERESVREQLGQNKWNGFLLRLAMLPHGAGWPAPKRATAVAKLAKSALDGCWSKVTKRARRLDRLSEEERHLLRKDLKKLRYTAEFVSSLYSKKDAKRFILALKGLQDDFGYLNDVALTRTLPEVLGPEADGHPALQRAIGFTLGWHAQHAEHAFAEASGDWARLRKQPKFWR